MGVKVYGASDDLIEIEGDIQEEFNFNPKGGESRFFAFSDGTLLRVHYDADGIWRLNKMAGGAAIFEKTEGDVSADTMDVVTLSGVTIRWCVLGDKGALLQGA